MERVPVSSSNIRSVGYDKETQMLEIEFDGGGIYQYLNVPEHVYSNLMSASSKGSYFHRHIRNRYRFRKVR